MGKFERVIWIVLDSVGIGALPDAADYDDVGRSTLGHIAEYRALQVPALVELGLANIAPLKNLAPAASRKLRMEKARRIRRERIRRPGIGRWRGCGWTRRFRSTNMGFRRKLSKHLKSRLAERRLGTSPLRGRRSSRNLVRSTSARGSRLSIPPATACFRLPRTRE